MKEIKKKDVKNLSKKERLVLVKERLSIKEAQDFNEELCDLVHKYEKKLDVNLILAILLNTLLVFHKLMLNDSLRGEMILPPKMKKKK